MLRYCSGQGEAFIAEPVLNALETGNGQFGMRSIAHSKVSVKGTEQIRRYERVWRQALSLTVNM